jgi:hypothetical protein
VSGCPHAPYADGPADFAIGLRPIAASAWLEGGEAPEAARARKLALLRDRPALVWAETPGSRPAQSEAAELVAATGRDLGDGGARPPLLSAALAVSDDLCLMERRAGAWTLTALSLSAGTFFTAAEVVGRTLGQLHGPVPGFAGRMLPRVERIFGALRPELVLERRNWTVIGDDALHLPDPAPLRAALPLIPLHNAGWQLFVRVERQTVRRLPQTGAVLFTIRVWTESLRSLGTRPERLKAFGRAWRDASPEFRTYKGLGAYDRLVEAFLAGAGFRPQGE